MLGPIILTIILGVLLLALCIRYRFVRKDDKERWILSGYIGILLFAWGVQSLVEQLNR